MDLGKIPPHDIDAEQAVLGSMLTDKDAVVEAVEILRGFPGEHEFLEILILQLINRRS